MPLKSRWKLPIDVCSLQTFLFGSQNATLPDKVAYYDAERPSTHFLTYEALRLWSLRLAAGLQKAGLQPGDRVLLFSGNNLFYPIAFMGILMAGGIFTGANPTYVTRELAYQLKDSDAKFLLCADGTLESAIEAAQTIGMGKERMFCFDNLLLDGTGTSRLGVKNWNILIEPESVGRNFRWYEPADPKDAICCLNYSSGTTGFPKGVMITHFNYIANAIQFAHLAQLDPNEPAKRKRSNWLCFLPLYHAMAQTIFIAGAVKRHIPVYMMKKFDFIGMLEAIQKYKITTLTMVPPIVVALAKSPITKKYNLSSVEDIGSGAAPLSGEVIEEVQALWPANGPKLKQGWGMTEVTCSLLGWDSTDTSIPSSVGELNANCSAKIMDPDGKTEVPRGERGEIWVQGPKFVFQHLRLYFRSCFFDISIPIDFRLSVLPLSHGQYDPTLANYVNSIMKGYWRNERATREVFVDCPDGRWMRTGDVAYVDPNGYFFIVDRIKELIKVKGNQVAPAELEALLLEHPQVADAAVIGVTIDWAEVPRAYIVLQQTAKGKVQEQEIADWLSKRVSKHKRLVGGVVFIDTIPKNPSGKIMRRLLRERAEEVKTPARARL